MSKTLLEANMKVAVIGSRNIVVEDLERYLPTGVTQLVSGGARGVDSCVRSYAERMNIPLVEFLPDYQRFGKAAPLKRNEEIVNYADCVVALWDGASRGTQSVIKYCQKQEKPLTIYRL